MRKLLSATSRVALCALAALTVVVTPAVAEYIPARGAVLQGLDKITARVSPLEIANGQTAAFHDLVVRVSACNVRPPEEPPEAAAFIEIFDGQPPGAETLFRGWMFASSPAVSAFEHPVYDIRVLSCLGREAKSGG